MGGPRTIPTLHAAILGAVLLLSGLVAGCGPDAADGSPSPVSTPGGSTQTLHEYGPEEPGEEMGWEAIDKLIDERRYRAALEAVAAMRERAREAGDEAEWTRTLVREIQLQTGLHGFETAVRRLREAAWPEAPIYRAVLDLYYAHGLVRYLEAYGWEIGQRERVESADEVDLRSWTREQIVAQAHRTFERIWRQRGAWGDEPLGELGEYVLANDYPRRIRGTLRDAVTYLWVGLAADTSHWGAGHERGLYRLDLEALIAGGAPAAEAAAGDPASAHPVELLAALLDDLEAWHRQDGRREAAFEARLERLRRLHSAFSRDDDRKAIRRGLERALAELGEARPWWSVGQALLAEWVRDAGGPDGQVRAREIALAGARAHPESVGGGRCRHIAAAIEAPQFGLEAMTADGLGRRSVRVTHRNLAELNFRAYRVDLLGVLEGAQDYNLLPGHREVQELVENETPLTQWRVELPPTPDYRRHATYVRPPLEEPGLYVLVASARPDFSESGNRRAAVRLLLGDLVVLTRQLDNEIEVTVRAGGNGRPVAGAEVLLYRYDWQNGHRRTAALRTGTDGTVRFAAGRWRRGSHIVLARRGNELALDPSYLDLQRRRRLHESTTALIYTDRSVYRPGQEVLWKVVAYRGSGEEGRFATLAGRSLKVELRDANGETVETAEVTTNDYGSASGAFTPPHGRLLGRWWLQTSLGGNAQIRVEEYKRPTFEVEITQPAEPLRLNLPATLGGEARYYFGLPVAGGDVSWQVTREPVYPPWRYWWFEPPKVAAETVAAGAAEVAADGTFSVHFTPEADEREAADGVTYRYRLSADVTDEGGETRSASRVFRVGFATVAATLEPTAGFLEAGKTATIDVRRHDLDGNPRAGAGVWRLFEVRQPERALLPAEQPVDPGEGHQTAGDRLRPRWDPGLQPAAALADWPDGRELLQGALSHDEDGEAVVRIPALGPGVYRLRYETRDPWDTVVETRRELVVAAPAATKLALPAVLLLEKPSVPVGEKIRLLVHSGLPKQELILEILRNGRRIERRRLESGEGLRIVEIPATREHRGGLGFRLTAVRDHQLLSFTGSVLVPWDDRRLEIGFATFRDRLRPGARESWRVTVRGAGEETLAAGAAELLAYMYDRSLDLFAPHRPPEPIGLYPLRGAPVPARASLGSGSEIWTRDRGWVQLPGYPGLTGDRLQYLPGYGIGGPGVGGRYRMARAPVPMMEGDARLDEMQEQMRVTAEVRDLSQAAMAEPEPEPAGEARAELRTDFSETAFWEPHLVLGEEGTVALEFTVPDSVTEWSVWVHALTRDLRAGSASREVKTVKELMVRPYLPRFLREGDRALLRVLVNNASERILEGRLDFELLDPDTDESLLAEFGLEAPAVLPFRVEPQGGAELELELRAPLRVGEVAVRVVARAGELSDGELRPLPLLPGRLHLSQARFAALKDQDRRELTFTDLADAGSDPSLIHDQLVVTLDAQLFYSVLRALPYLVDYPYECTEQTVNRFLSTGILSSLYDDYPAVARMARELSARPTRFESWDEVDPNRKMALEETPWRVAARGGAEPEDDLIRVLDPRVVEAEKRAALAKLEKAQTSLGGFPWWPGGPPSPYMTLYILHSFARGLEFQVGVPRDLVVRAWAYLHRHYVDELVREMTEKACCWELVTFLNYVLSAYPDDSWTGGLFTAEDRERMLEFSHRHWREHSPLLKGYLALTLARAGRAEEARRIFDSVMDSARTDRDLGTYWAPEERAWLWYNDTIEGHAFALRTLTELTPDDARRHGLVQWLLLNKKLNHWKSTRATAEVVYALVHYLEREGALGVREAATVTAGPRSWRLVFEPDRLQPEIEPAPGAGGGAVGQPNQIVIPGAEIDPATMTTIVVQKSTPSFLFASATWHFSTDRLPEEARGDLFQVARRYFRRVHEGGEWVLRPLAEEAPLAVGDQIEVHLSITARHAAEYVHLRDPRGAGFEPQTLRSGYKWDLGVGWYEEVRDSGTNFFFEWLPAGEYTFRYRLRAATAGVFRAGPATLQSMYAPEFTAYSAGHRLVVD